MPILVPALSTVLAAFVAAISGYLTAGWRIREVKLSYEQRIRDRYLDNARGVLADVYVPLSIAVSSLNKSYLEFRAHVDFDLQSVPIGAVNRFKGACGSFARTLEELHRRGASAYLTLPLEEELTAFSLFLSESMDAQQIRKKITMSPAFFSDSHSHTYESGGKLLAAILKATSVLSSTALLPVGAVKFTFKEEVLASPVHDREFERQFQKRLVRIISLIKEVTLGSSIDPKVP